MWKRLLRREGKRAVGERGERLAVAYLKGRGYRIAATNLRVPVGRSPSGRAIVGEIDIVAYDGATLCFVEVKTRRREGLYAVERAVDAHKRRLLVAASRRYRGLFGVANDPYRFDVVTVLLPEGGRPKVRLLEGYFSARSQMRRP